MRVGLHDADKKNYPNLALMKLSSWHKLCGDMVGFFDPQVPYDLVYSSKVFTFTPDDPLLPVDAVRGGTGYDIRSELPDYVEACFPDYSLGFLTRGCPRKCNWCFVPEKEGGIRAAADIERFLAHKTVVLMDNNVLAHPHGISQIEKMAAMGIKVDFNQGLDARLIDGPMAKLLSKLKWSSPLRLACDSDAMIEPIRRAVEHLRWHNTTPRQYFSYLLVQDVEEALERTRFLKGIYVDPFAQPFMAADGTPPTRYQKQFARWVNLKQLFKSQPWEEYKIQHNVEDL